MKNLSPLIVVGVALLIAAAVAVSRRTEIPPALWFNPHILGQMTIAEGRIAMTIYDWRTVRWQDGLEVQFEKGGVWIYLPLPRGYQVVPLYLPSNYATSNRSRWNGQAVDYGITVSVLENSAEAEDGFAEQFDNLGFYNSITGAAQ